MMENLNFNIRILSLVYTFFCFLVLFLFVGGQNTAIAADSEQEFKEMMRERGSWYHGNYVDDFGDETAEGYVLLGGSGVFSNTAVTNESLRVEMVLSIDNVTHQYRESDRSELLKPTFRLHEYNRRLIKGAYDPYRKFLCRVKDQNGNISNANLYQAKGWDYFALENGDRLSTVIKEEGAVTFACTSERWPTDTYRFNLDFHGLLFALERYALENK